MRLFVAIPLPPPGQAQVRRYRELAKSACPSYRWVSPEQLHIMLQFLGEADESTVEAAKGAVTTVASGRPIALRLARAIFLPTSARPTELALKLDGETDELQSLQVRLVAAFARIEIAGEDHPFLPYVTVARQGDSGGGQPGRLPAPPRAWFRATSLALFSSHADGSGRWYKSLAALPLADM